MRSQEKTWLVSDIAQALDGRLHIALMETCAHGASRGALMYEKLRAFSMHALGVASTRMPIKAFQRFKYEQLGKLMDCGPTKLATRQPVVKALNKVVVAAPASTPISSTRQPSPK